MKIYEKNDTLIVDGEFGLILHPCQYKSLLHLDISAKSARVENFAFYSSDSPEDYLLYTAEYLGYTGFKLKVLKFILFLFNRRRKNDYRIAKIDKFQADGKEKRKG